MSNEVNIFMSSTLLERHLRHDGIVAVFDLTAGVLSWAGEEHWKPIVLEATRLRQIANEPTIRVLVGEHTILLVSDEKHTVGLVFLMGYPIVKSVARMIRQLMRSSSIIDSGLDTESPS